MEEEPEEFPLVTDLEKARRDVQRSIAKMLLMRHGDGAYLVALTELETNPKLEQGWRDILNFMDEITKGENNDLL